MQFSELTIKLIILFLPGLISASLLQMFGNNRKLDNREFFVLVVVNGFISYLIPCLFCGNNTFFKSLLDNSMNIDYKEVLYSSTISVGLGIVETYFVNYCLLYKIAQWAKLTTKSGQDTVWDEFLDNEGKGISNFVYIRNYETNEIYCGSVANYSMSLNSQKEIILNNVDVYDLNDRSNKLYHLEKIYLCISDDKNIVIEIGESYNDGKENKDNTGKSK